MHFPDWLLPAFFGTFILLGIGLGYWLRMPVWLITLVMAFVVWVLFVVGESAQSYGPFEITRERMFVGAYIAFFAAIPLLGGVALGRFIKNRREK